MASLWTETRAIRGVTVHGLYRRPAGHLSSHTSPAGVGGAGSGDHCVFLAEKMPAVYEEWRAYRETLRSSGEGEEGQYRLLEGARHSTLTTDRPDDVVRAVRDLIGTAGR